MENIAKCVFAAIFVVSFICSIFTWVIGEPPDGVTPEVYKQVRIASTSTLVAVFALAVWAARRKDRVPDFLRGRAPHCFERHGLCFSIVPSVCNEVFVLLVYHQNRYSRPCTGKILLVPPYAGKEAAVTIPIQCEPAGFGVSRIPLAVAAAHQGMNLNVQVYADVTYAVGRGKLLRFKEGAVVGGTASEKSRNVWIGLGRLALGLDLSVPANMELQLPVGVADVLPPDATVASQTFWRLGDLDLELQVQT